MSDENYREKLKNFFRKNLAKGYTQESLKWALIQQGYSRTDIARVIEEINKEKEEIDKKASGVKERPKIKYELYDKDNKLIKVETRKSFSIVKFFKNLFSKG